MHKGTTTTRHYQRVLELKGKNFDSRIRRTAPILAPGSVAATTTAVTGTSMLTLRSHVHSPPPLTRCHCSPSFFLTGSVQPYPCAHFFFIVCVFSLQKSDFKAEIKPCSRRNGKEAKRFLAAACSRGVQGPAVIGTVKLN